MMNYDFGDVVLVPFPFIDKPVYKLRPALVLSGRPDGEEGRHLLLAMITSAKRSRWASDTVLTEWRAAGLKGSSVVRYKMFTIESSLVQAMRGSLLKADLS